MKTFQPKIVMHGNRLNDFVNQRFVQSLRTFQVLPQIHTYPEIVFFMGLNEEVKTSISFFACFTALSSVRPTTDKGGWLAESKIVRSVIKTALKKKVQVMKSKQYVLLLSACC